MITSFLNKKPFTYSFFAALFFSTVPYLFFIPYHQTNDDFYINLTAKGFGVACQPSAYIFNANIILGFLLKALNGTNNYWPWHGFILIAGLFLALWAYLFVVITTGLNNKYKIFIFTLAYLGVDLYFFIFLHYTCVALLCCQGGFFLLFGMLKNQTWSIKNTLLSGLCFLLCALLRFDAFLLSGLLVLPSGIHLARFVKRYPFKRKMFYSLAITATLIFGSAFLNRWCFDQKPDWKVFNQLDRPTKDLLDHKHVQYNTQTKPLLDQVHWTKNDVDLFSNWFFLDDQTYSFKNLALLSNSLPVMTKNPDYPLGSIFEYLPTQCCILITLCFLLETSSSESIWICISLIWALLLHAFLFLFMKSPPWVFAPLLVFPLHLSIFFSNKKTPDEINDKFSIFKNGFFKNIFLVLAALFALYNCIHYYWEDKVNQNIDIAVQKDIHLLNPKDNQLFVVWHNTMPYESISVFDDNQNFKTFHIFQLQGFQRAPTSAELLYKFHVKYLEKEIIDNPNIFMICNQGEGILYLKHMEEKYNLSVSLQKAFHSLSFDAYRVLSIKK